jgi:uncharacterized protein YqcC (DUF446 family)
MRRVTDLSINETVLEINREMQLQGLWKKEMPDWVTDYDKRGIRTEEDFARWLQFVFLPNCLMNDRKYPLKNRKYIVPQAKKYFSRDIQKGRLLQLLIELDALI